MKRELREARAFVLFLAVFVFLSEALVAFAFVLLMEKVKHVSFYSFHTFLIGISMKHEKSVTKKKKKEKRDHRLEVLMDQAFKA